MWVYVVECLTPDYFYVGQTNDSHRRIAEHRGKGPNPGSVFVQRHGFKKLAHIEYIKGIRESKDRERELTLEMIRAGHVVASNFANVRANGSVVLNAPS